MEAPIEGKKVVARRGKPSNGKAHVHTHLSYPSTMDVTYTMLPATQSTQ